MNLTAPKLPKRHVVFDTPHEHLPVKRILRSPNLMGKGPQMILDQILLVQKTFQRCAPTEFHPGVRYGTGMPQDKDNPHPREIRMEPLEHQICPDILD